MLFLKTLKNIRLKNFVKPLHLSYLLPLKFFIYSVDEKIDTLKNFNFINIEKDASVTDLDLNNIVPEYDLLEFFWLGNSYFHETFSNYFLYFDAEILYIIYLFIIFFVLIFINKKSNLFLYVMHTYELILYSFLLNVFLFFIYLKKYFFLINSFDISYFAKKNHLFKQITSFYLNDVENDGIENEYVIDIAANDFNILYENSFNDFLEFNDSIDFIIDFVDNNSLIFDLLDIFLIEQLDSKELMLDLLFKSSEIDEFINVSLDLYGEDDEDLIFCYYLQNVLEDNLIIFPFYEIDEFDNIISYNDIFDILFETNKKYFSDDLLVEVEQDENIDLNLFLEDEDLYMDLEIEMDLLDDDINYTLEEELLFDDEIFCDTVIDPDTGIEIIDPFQEGFFDTADTIDIIDEEEYYYYNKLLGFEGADYTNELIEFFGYEFLEEEFEFDADNDISLDFNFDPDFFSNFFLVEFNDNNFRFLTEYDFNSFDWYSFDLNTDTINFLDLLDLVDSDDTFNELIDLFLLDSIHGDFIRSDLIFETKKFNRYLDFENGIIDWNTMFYTFNDSNFILHKSKLFLNNIYISDNYSMNIKFLLVFFFLFINIIMLFYIFSPLKGGLILLFKNNLFLKGFIPTKYSLLNLEFLRNYLLLVYFVNFFLFNLISSYDLLFLFVCIEGITLCLYVLAGLKYNNRLSIEAGLKYFLISSVFSCIFGMGLFLLYFVTNSTNFYEIREIILIMVNSSAYYNDFLILLYIAILLIIIVFLMKLGAVPYHFWIGDIYQGSPILVTTFFATITRIAFFAIFFRLICHVFYFSLNLSLFNILFFFGILSIIYGSFYSLNQFELKKFLAYSSIVHTGFILLGLSTMTFDGFKSAFFYLIIYLFTLLSFFFILLTSQTIFQFYDINTKKFYTRDFKYFSDLITLPISLRIFLTFLLFSMAGLPPLPGFLIKLYVFKAVLYEILNNIQLSLILNSFNLNNLIMIFLLIVIVILSFLTAYNYIRIIIKMLFSSKQDFINKDIFLVTRFYNANKIISWKFYFNILNFIIILHILIIFFAGKFYNFNFLFYDNISTLLHPFFFEQNYFDDIFQFKNNILYLDDNLEISRASKLFTKSSDISIYFNDHDVDDLNASLKIHTQKYSDSNIRYFYESLLSITSKLNK